MNLILSEDLVLGDWYRTSAVGDWIRQDITVKPLTFSEHAGSPITRVYFHETVSDHFAFVFTGRLKFMNQVYRDLYDKQLRQERKASFFRHDQVEEAKAFINSFVPRIWNLRAFL